MLSDQGFEMEQEIQSTMVREKEAWSALGSAEQRVLGALFHQHAGQTFSSLLPSEAWAREGLSGAEAKLAFAVLCRKGWICSMHKSWGERSYYIPTCHLAALTLVYADRVGLHIAPMTGSVKKVIKEGKPHIAAELLHLLAWVLREGLPVTGKGTIHKRNVQKLSTLTVLSCDDFKHIEISYEHDDLYPVHVMMMLDLLLCLQLVQKTGKGFEINEEPLRQWLKLPWSAMHREIFRICMDRYGAQDAEGQHFRYQLALLGPGLDEWCVILNEEENFGIKGWVYALAGWGFGEIGESTAGELVFRWLMNPVDLLHDTVCWMIEPDRKQEKDEKRSGGIYVQPDLEIMVPPDVSAAVCWWLECCSERITRDQLSIYRLSKERIVKAHAGGFTYEAIADFLQRHAVNGVPKHVLAALKDWTQACQEIEGSSTHLTLSLEGVRGQSEDQGKGSLGAAECTESPEGLLRLHVMPGAMVNPSDAALDLLQDVNGKAAWDKRKADVPETWHRDWRKYHMSTARQIAVQAVEWQVKLGIREGDETLVLIPHQVQGHERWTLEAWCIVNSDETAVQTEWRTLIPDRWDSMRLILPDDV